MLAPFPLEIYLNYKDSTEIQGHSRTFKARENSGFKTKHGSFVLCKFTFCILVRVKKILGKIDAKHISVMPEMIRPKKVQLL